MSAAYGVCHLPIWLGKNWNQMIATPRENAKKPAIEKLRSTTRQKLKSRFFHDAKPTIVPPGSRDIANEHAMNAIQLAIIRTKIGVNAGAAGEMVMSAEHASDTIPAK